jgi:hypothetical protein
VNNVQKEYFTFLTDNGKIQPHNTNKNTHMFRLLKFLLTGDWHLHKWKIVEKVDTSNESGARWKRHYCQCEHCGVIKIFDKGNSQ